MELVKNHSVGTAQVFFNLLVEKVKVVVPDHHAMKAYWGVQV
jgi:hypothetical protein